MEKIHENRCRQACSYVFVQVNKKHMFSCIFFSLLPPLHHNGKGSIVRVLVHGVSVVCITWCVLAYCWFWSVGNVDVTFTNVRLDITLSICHVIMSTVRA